MIDKLKTETDARSDAKDLWKIRNQATETQFVELAYSMMMQRFHIGVCYALDEARLIIKDVKEQPAGS